MADRTAHEAAAQWFVRLQDASTPSQAFLDWQRWMNAAPEHRRAYEEIEEAMLRMRAAPTPPPLPKPDEMERDSYDGSVPVRAYLQAPPKRVSARRNLAIAASVAALAVTLGLTWLQVANEGPSDTVTYSTAPAEQRKVTLVDGSVVMLDASSALTVRMSESQRALQLDHGEAYFQVAKDASRPFIVHAGGAQVRAVGTAFNVRMSEGRTVVAVVEGKVEVTTETARPSLPELSPDEFEPAQPRVSAAPVESSTESPSSVQLIARLSAGEAIEARAQDGKLEVLPAHVASTATTWTEGRRQYRSEPLRYILADVSRHTNRRIEVADQATGDLRFTGTLNLKNSEAWLRGLSVALPVRVREGADGALVVEGRE